MTRTIEIRNANKAPNLNDICEKVYLYQKDFLSLISSGKSYPKRFLLDNSRTVLIWHTDKAIIAEVV